MKPRRLPAAAALVALAAGSLALAQPTGQAATPSSGSISESSPSTSWSGSVDLATPAPGELGCLSPTDPRCDHFTLTVDAPDGGSSLEIEVTPDDEFSNLDIHVFDSSGQRIGGGEGYDTADGAAQAAVVADPPDDTYTISVQLRATRGAATYTALAQLAGEGIASPYTVLVPDPNESPRIDLDGRNCSEFVPTILGIGGVTDPGDTISLDVLMLLDGISVERATGIVEVAATSYDELGIDFNVVAYDTSFSVPSEGDVIDLNGGVRGEIQNTALFAAAKAHVGGERPDGVDIVYAMTNKEIWHVSADSPHDDTLLGQADCIGGVRFDDLAFAIGEGWADQIGSSVFGVDLSQHVASALILAHEVGHLMGAHHHYGECATGQRPHEFNERVDPRHPCTLMFPSAGPNNMPFSALNSAVVRGHADGYARP